MNNSPARSARRIAIYLRFLSRLGFATSKPHAMTNAQWAALEFFGSVNRHSRTLRGFAEYHSTTLGSASQTIDRLVKKKLLVRVQDKHDGRRARFDLTENALNIAADGPLDAIIPSISALSSEQRVDLEVILQDVLSKISTMENVAILGRCQSCQFRREQHDPGESGILFICSKFGHALSEADSEEECVHYAPTDTVLVG